MSDQQTNSSSSEEGAGREPLTFELKDDLLTEIGRLLALVQHYQTQAEAERVRADRNEIYGRELKHENGKLRKELQTFRSEREGT